MPRLILFTVLKDSDVLRWCAEAPSFSYPYLVRCSSTPHNHHNWWYGFTFLLLAFLVLEFTSPPNSVFDFSIWLPQSYILPSLTPIQRSVICNGLLIIKRSKISDVTTCRFGLLLNQIANSLSNQALLRHYANGDRFLQTIISLPIAASTALYYHLSPLLDRAKYKKVTQRTCLSFSAIKALPLLVSETASKFDSFLESKEVAFKLGLLGLRKLTRI